jgi:regulator of cell morphogenesis and NO signaling
MDMKPMECAGMGNKMGNGNQDKVLCDPLERLKSEHISLREKMSQFHDLAESIGNEPNVNYNDQLSKLQQLVSFFSVELWIHSGKEEDTLFPMMARYIGRDVGPIAVMEYEHEQARIHLQNFRENTKHIQAAVEMEEAKAIASHVIQAYTMLSSHFTKEDTILFPMADKMLSVEDKAQLKQRI